MDHHNSMEVESITRLNKETASIEAKSKLPSHLCGVQVKNLSDEVKAIAKMVLHEYTTAIGSTQKGEMLSDLEVRLKDLFEIMAKCQKILDMLNRRTIVAVFKATQYVKKIKTYHERLKRIRADLETTITRLKVSWGQRVLDTLEPTTNNECSVVLQDLPSTTPPFPPTSSAPPYGRETNNVGDDIPTQSDEAASHYGQREQGSGNRNSAPTASLFSSLANSSGDTAAVAIQIGEQLRTRTPSSIGAGPSVQPESREVPSASLSNTTAGLGDLSLNTIGNDVNNTTVNDNSRYTGVGNTTVLNVQNMVFNNFWILQ